MLSLEIRKLGDPVLRESCYPVDEYDSEIKSLSKKMVETIHAEEGRVGLAAPQVGVLKRLFVYDTGNGARCFLNPEIVEADEEVEVEEGCLSIPGVYVRIPRFRRVRMRCLTPSGHRITIEAEGFLAEVVQHECDHLDGVLIIDRCEREERKRAMQEYQQLQLARQQSGA